MLRTCSLRCVSCGASCLRRANARSRLVSLAPESAALDARVSSSRSCRLVKDSSSSSRLPEMIVRMLLKSCAMPPVS